MREADPEFLASLSYTERPYLRRPKKKKKRARHSAAQLTLQHCGRQENQELKVIFNYTIFPRLALAIWDCLNKKEKKKKKGRKEGDKKKEKKKMKRYHKKVSKEKKTDLKKKVENTILPKGINWWFHRIKVQRTLTCMLFSLFRNRIWWPALWLNMPHNQVWSPDPMGEGENPLRRSSSGPAYMYSSTHVPLPPVTDSKH